ncbi:hypothetical protein C8N35_105191 [Breoghania corrubedonensis]|uniref:Uncharacterized protein n=1 Tax=Breoghania corrubedonensis TaxID=665038 RepID=A0A2T5V8W0_9HYPH|nr:hypothetical protein C8N35_105191 [Breoghania corrubedonensis]
MKFFSLTGAPGVPLDPVEGTQDLSHPCEGTMMELPIQARPRSSPIRRSVETQASENGRTFPDAPARPPRPWRQAYSCSDILSGGCDHTPAAIGKEDEADGGAPAVVDEKASPDKFADCGCGSTATCPPEICSRGYINWKFVRESPHGGG